MELKPVFSADAIQRRVREMAAEIDALYGDEPLVVICVLKGAFFFFSDLVRAMNKEVAIDFVRLASYGSGTESSGHVQLTKDVELSLEGRHVLIVEDIVDTGRSMDFFISCCQARGAASVRLAVLIDKLERREVTVHADFAGFSLPGGFLVGYGLDCEEKYRTLPAVYELTGC